MPNQPMEERPDAYIQGMIEFFLLPFFTDERALIPRLETESLVRRALVWLRAEPFDRVIDVGTGSGIIAVSIAKNAPNIPVTALDISPDALDLAKKNAKRNEVSIDFRQSDLLSGISGDHLLNQKLLIVTNLPYISLGSKELSPDTVFEPALALFWGENTGFELYDRFFREAWELLRDTTAGFDIYLEMGHDQEEIAKETLSDYPWKYVFFKDLRGIPRFIHIQYRPWESLSHFPKTT